MMQSGNVTVMSQMQQPVIVSQTKPQQSPQQKKNLKIIKYLGITELLLGSLSIILGIAIAAYFNSLATSTTTTVSDGFFTFTYDIPTNYFRLTFGEGIWCGIWIVIAGSLGAAAGQKNSNSGLVGAHMGFAIVGTIFAGILLCIAAPLTALASVSSDPITATALYAILAIVGFSCFVLQIVSAAYCCTLTGQCCGGSGTSQDRVIIQPSVFNPAPIPTTMSSPQTTYYTQTPYVQTSALPGQQPVSTPQYGF